MTGQAAIALRRAHEVQAARGQIRRELRSLPYLDAKRRCGQMLLDPSPDITTWRVDRLLESCRGIGPAVAARILAHREINGTRTVGELTVRQRIALAAALGAFDMSDRAPGAA